MYIAHIASELAPVAKVGGLADVLLGLSRELSRLGHDVDIFIPKYDCMDTSRIGDFKIDGGEFKTYWKGEWFPCLIWRGWVKPQSLLRGPSPSRPLFFLEAVSMDADDDADRFVFFSRAVLEFLKTRRLCPDILQVHDWQTAVAPLLLKEVYKEQELKKVKTVFTIHNLSYQGIIDPATF